MTGLPKTPAVWAGIILALLVACGLPIAGVGPQVSPEGQGPAITARIGLSGSKSSFRTAAVLPNLHHFTVKLYREGSADPLQTQQVPGALPADVRFPITHYGRYYITADAFSSTDDSVRLSIQGAVRSSNTAIVESTDTPPSGLPSGGPSGLPSTMPSAMPSAMPSGVPSPGVAQPIDWSRVRIRYSSGTSLQVALNLVDSAKAAIDVTVSGAPPTQMPGFVATLVDSQDRAVATYTGTGHSGSFRFVNVPDGTYTVQGALGDRYHSLLTHRGATSVQVTGQTAAYGDGSSRIALTLPFPTTRPAYGTGSYSSADPRSYPAGTPATSVPLPPPFALALDTSNRLYVLDYFGLVKRVEADGTLTPFAGGSSPTALPSPLPDLSHIADGGTAADARFSQGLNGANRLRTGRDGFLYYSDEALNMVRRIKPDGSLVQRVAGSIVNGVTRGFSGDGGPATSAQLHAPDATADADGRIYICDTGNHRIRCVEPDGTIRTIAGNGEAVNSGDGGPAAGARVKKPRFPVIDSRRRLYFLAATSLTHDAPENALRYIDLATGTIHKEMEGYMLTDVTDLTLGPGGDLYINRIGRTYRVWLGPEEKTLTYLPYAVPSGVKAIAVTPDGQLFQAQWYGYKVWVSH